ncbi:MAG TPA: glycosyltransferase [Rhizomicrobium sp.]|nr:glycosyltransferase [Rhizomicrobium sp.]
MPAEKVAIFIPSLAGGGAERVALFVCEALSQAGYAVDLVVARNKGALVDHPAARAWRVDLGARNEMLCLFRLIRYARRSKPDVMIAMVHSAKIMAGLAKLFVPGLPLIISVHNNLDLPRQKLFWVRRLFGFALERRLYRGVIAAHAVSRALAQQVVTFFALPPERVHTIYNPLIARDGPADLPPGHESWFERPVLISAGRLVPQKDHAALVRAFAASGLASRASLLILGEGPLRRELEELGASLGLGDSMRLPGAVPGITPYLRRAKGFLLSSRYEGLPLVLVEALAAGLPIAAFDCPTGPAEVLNDGALGRLLDLGDQAGLAQAMKDIISGELAAPSGAAVQAQIAKFEPARIARQYIDLVAARG